MTAITTHIVTGQRTLAGDYEKLTWKPNSAEEAGRKFRLGRFGFIILCRLLSAEVSSACRPTPAVPWRHKLSVPETGPDRHTQPSHTVNYLTLP